MSQENVEVVRGTFAEFERGNFWVPEVFDPSIRVVWLEDGDHSFKPRASSGKTERGHLEEAVRAVAELARG